MNPFDNQKEIQQGLLRKSRQSSFTWTRGEDLGLSSSITSNTVFGRLERAYPEKIGFYYLLCSILFMSLNAYFTQMADELPVPEITFFRSLFMMVGIYIFISRYHADLDVGDRSHKKIVLILCLIGFPTALSYVYGVVRLQLTDAITIMISTPIFVSIFSWFLFNSGFKKEQLTSIILWLIGVTLVIRPSFSSSSTAPVPADPTTTGETTTEVSETPEDTTRFRGVIACLLNALLTASSSIVVKARNVRIPPIMLMTYGTLINLILSGVLSLFSGFTIPEGSTWLNLIAISFLFFYGQFFLMKSLEHASSGVNAALINNIQIVLIYIIQIAFIQEFPSFWSFAGTILVVAACIVLASLSR